jgi:hypothetical protein
MRVNLFCEIRLAVAAGSVDDPGQVLPIDIAVLCRRSHPAMLQFHVGVSLVGILSGLVVLYGLLIGEPYGAWTAVFLATTILTSASGFPLPPYGFDPPRAVGVISLVLLAIAVAAYYGFRLEGAWRWIYVLTAVAALYLNVFVLIAQAFMKVPALKALAPTQKEPPFLVAQIVALVIFVALGAWATVGFHPAVGGA